MILNGCTTNNKLPIVQTKIIYETIPEQFIKDCPNPHIDWKTVSDIIYENTALRGALNTCRAQIAGTRKFNQELLKRNGLAAKKQQ